MAPIGQVHRLSQVMPIANRDSDSDDGREVAIIKFAHQLILQTMIPNVYS